MTTLYVQVAANIGIGLLLALITGPRTRRAYKRGHAAGMALERRLQHRTHVHWAADPQPGKPIAWAVQAYPTTTEHITRDEDPTP